jgi:single-strand DNA-binding protein
MKVLSYLLIAFRIKESYSWIIPHQASFIGRDLKSISLRMSEDDFEVPDEQDFTDNNEDDGRLSDEELEAMLGNWDDRVARLNTIHLVGRVGNAPEPKYLDGGKVVVNLSLACKRKLHYSERQAFDIKSGDEETDWYSLEIWGQTAEFVSKYVDKGGRVGVIGGLQIDEWNDKETGEKRNKAKVVVREFDILESKAESDLRRQNSRGPSFGDDDEYKPSSGSAGGFFG